MFQVHLYSNFPGVTLRAQSDWRVNQSSLNESDPKVGPREGDAQKGGDLRAGEKGEHKYPQAHLQCL